jgi:hypothetical protein
VGLLMLFFPTFFSCFFFLIIFVENETNQRVTKDASKLARKRRRWEWDTMIHTHSQAVKHREKKERSIKKDCTIIRANTHTSGDPQCLL